MPSTVLDARVRAAYRARACAAGFAVGAQLFAVGAGVCMSVSLNAAYLSVLPALPLGALTAYCARRRLSRGDCGAPMTARALRTLLALLLLLSAAFLTRAAVSLAGQSLLPQAQILSLALTTLLAVALLALPGGTASARLCFALRWAIPALLLLLTAAALPFDTAVGLFPLLGPGSIPLGLSALGALCGAAPAALLFLPPPELEGVAPPPQALPGAWFFIWRVLAGGLVAALLLLALTLGGTFVSMQSLRLWGERMLVLYNSQPHEGILHMLTLLCQQTGLLLGAAVSLCGAQQAVGLAFPPLQKRRADWAVCALALAAAVIAPVLIGMDWALRVAPGMTVILAALLAMHGKL